MQLTPVSKDSFGIFFKGDTYLVFSSAAETSATKSTFVQHIHLWIGDESCNVLKINKLTSYS
jgi:hypothetical protein